MIIPVRREPSPPIMWRAYQVGLNKGGQLILAGAFNGKWTDVDFTAKCKIGTASDGQAMSQRVHQSKVFLPGELQGIKRRDDEQLAHRRCKMHLEAGSCGCGIWGYIAPARVQREYLTTPFWTGRDSGYSSSNLVQVLCSVRIYGTVLVGEYGYRASNGRIESMFVPANIEMFAQRNTTTLEPMFDANSMSFFTTGSNGYGYGGGVPQRLDPAVVWKKIASTYDAVVVQVGNGMDMINQLDQYHPDPVLKPIESMTPKVQDLDFGMEDDDLE